MRTSIRLTTSVSAVALALATLTACGSSSTDNSKPVAQIDALSGSVHVYRP